MLILLLALVLATLTSPTPPAADTTAAPEGRFSVLLRPIWSRTSGFGIGAAYQVDHVGGAGTRLRLSAHPNQHTGRYSVTYTTGEVRKAPLAGTFNLFYETVGRQWFYGLGPSSRESALVRVERSRREAEARLTLSPPGTAFFVQPRLRLVAHHVAGFRDHRRGAFERMDLGGRQHLDDLLATPERTGLWVGLAGGLDTRDAGARPRGGVLLQGEVSRFAPLTPDLASLVRVDIAAHGFFPVGASGVLALRGVAAVTAQGAGTPAAFFQLPTLNASLLPGYEWDRFFGNDLLSLSVEYRHLVFAGFNLAGLEALGAVHAGSVYDDLFEQFTPAVTFEHDVAARPGRYPLRPALSVGARVIALSSDAVYLQGVYALSPEGSGTSSFGFVVDLLALDWYKQ